MMGASSRGGRGGLGKSRRPRVLQRPRLVSHTPDGLWQRVDSDPPKVNHGFVGSAGGNDDDDDDGCTAPSVLSPRVAGRMRAAPSSATGNDDGSTAPSFGSRPYHR